MLSVGLDLHKLYSQVEPPAEDGTRHSAARGTALLRARAVAVRPSPCGSNLCCMSDLTYRQTGRRRTCQSRVRRAECVEEKIYRALQNPGRRLLWATATI